MLRMYEGDLQGMLATTAPGHEACHPDVLCLVIIRIMTNQRHHLLNQSEGNVITRHHLITDISDI